MRTHITHLGLENFRIIKNRTDFVFSPITILTGTNSSGKSSLISAMELVHGLPLRREVDTSIGENKYPEILENICSLDLYKYAGIKGDFSNLKSNKANESNCIEFSFLGFLSKMGVACRITLGYSSKSNEIGFKNGELSKLRITAFKQEDHSEIEVYSLTSINDVLKVSIDWRFFYEKYKSNAARFVSNAKNLKNPQMDGLQAIREAISKDAQANSFLHYDKATSAFKMFDLNDVFLHIPTYHASVAQLNKRFEALKMFIDSYNLNVSEDLLQENITLDAIFKKLNDNLIPHLQQSFLENSKLVYYTLRESPISASGFIKALKEIEFNGQFLVGQVKSQSAFESFLYDFECTLSFSGSPNGNAAKIFFNQFILGQIHELLAETIPQFQGINFLKTNRHFAKRRTEIADITQVGSQSAYYLNLLLRCEPATQKAVLDYLNLYFSQKYLNVADEVSIKAADQTKDSVAVMLRKGDNWFNLLDEGHGINTVFLVVLLASMANDKENTMLKKCHEPIDSDANDRWQTLTWPTVLVIEEPESNLHPALQSKLADVFVHVAENFKTQFIIETHSEYLIRKLQYLTARGKIEPEDTVIYYFYPPDHPDVVSGSEDQVKKINIRNDGSLTSEFGSGFFDEADNIALELFLLKKSQEN